MSATMQAPVKMGIYNGKDKQNFNKDLLRCMRERKTQQVKEILQNCNLGNSIDKTKSNLLHYAAKYGTNLIGYLVNAGCNVNAQNKLGKTPLILAVEESQESIVEDLLNVNADICITDNQGKNALQLACNPKICRSITILKLCITKLGKQYGRNNKEIAKKLLEAKCPLYFVMHLKNSAVTKILIDNGLDVNSCDPATGETALHEAAKLTDVENIQLLLDSGANVNAKDHLDRLAFFSTGMTINRDENFEVFKILLDRGLQLTPLNYRGEMQAELLRYLDKKFVELVFEYDVDFMTKDAMGNTILHYLANRKSINFDKLKGKKFDFAACDENGSTVLQLALRHDNDSLLNCLLDSNAKIDHPNEELVELLTSPGSNGVPHKDIVDTLMNHDEGINFVLKNYEKILSYSLNKHSMMYEYVPALAAMLDARGTFVSNDVLSFINSVVTLEKRYNTYKSQLNNMKKEYVSESITLYDLLTEDKSKIELYMRNENVVAAYDELVRKFYVDKYFIKVLQKRVEKPYRLTKLKIAAFLSFCEITGMDVAAGNIIAYKVFEYLEENDLKILSEL